MSCAGLLGVEEVQAGLSPEQKLAAILTAQQQGSSNSGLGRGKGVIMVRSRPVSLEKLSFLYSALAGRNANGIHQACLQSRDQTALSRAA